MSQKNSRKNCFEEKIPVYTCGNYFLAMGGLIKKLEREPTIEVISLQSHEEVKEKLKGPGHGVFVCHAPNREDAIFYLDLIHKFGPKIEPRKKRLLLVTGLITPLMGSKLRKFGFLQIVDASVEAFDLFDKVITAVLCFEPDSLWKGGSAPKEIIEPSSQKTEKKKPPLESPEEVDRKNKSGAASLGVFHPLSNPLRILSCLRECKKYEIKVSLWIQSCAKKYEVLITLVDDVNQVFVIAPYETTETLGLDLKRWFTSDEVIYFSMTTRRARFFFTTYFAASSSERMVQMLFPEEVYEVQRRAQLRLEVYPEKELYAVIEGASGAESKSYRIDNLSSRGLALLVDQADLGCFAVGEIVQNLSFTIPDHAVAIKSCEVRHISAYPNEQGKYLVGIYLQSATAHQAAVIEFYVYQENLTYLQAVS